MLFVFKTFSQYERRKKLIKISSRNWRECYENFITQTEDPTISCQIVFRHFLTACVDSHDNLNSFLFDFLLSPCYECSKKPQKAAILSILT